GLKLNDVQLQRGQYVFMPDLDPMVRRAWEYYNGNSYGVNSYSKPGIVLTTLQNYLGKETMLKIMRTYVERWRFKHPKTQDFIDIANEVSGQDLSWYFDQAFFSNAVLDYSVDAVFSRSVRKDRGFDFDLSTEEDETEISDAEQDSVQAMQETGNGEASSNGDLEIAKSDEKDSVKTEEEQKMYDSGVNIRRLGDFKFPVEVELVFDGGEKIRETWDGQDLWKNFRYTKPAKLVSATVDPEHKIIIDVNYTNNSRSVKSHSAGANKLATRLLFWMQFLMDQPVFLNWTTVFN
ncbi:MAG: M1 family aminopeptidase, partial [bacterium]